MSPLNCFFLNDNNDLKEKGTFLLFMGILIILE